MRRKKETTKESHGFHNPIIAYIVINLAVNSAIFYFVVGVFPFVNNDPARKYAWPFFAFQFMWIMFGIAYKKYLSLRERTIGKVVAQCLKADFLALLSGIALLIFFADFKYSIGFLLALSGSFLISELILIFLFYSFGEAQLVNVEIPPLVPVSKPAHEQVEHPLDDETVRMLEKLIRDAGGIRLLEFLRISIRPFVSSSLFVNTTSRFNIEKVSVDRYISIVNLKVVNEIREINAFFAAVNDKLPVGGIFIACFETKSQRKKRILGEHPNISSYFLYGFDYLFRRVMPKLNLTREFYFWVTNGTNRALSKAEVFGRLCYSGFEILSQRKIYGLSYVVARKMKAPIRKEVTNYSPIIKLQRLGKNRKIIKVYKLRTMHPYSEYLQGYIYKHHNLHKSGKFKTDIRVTTLGRFLRKYWLDELPMIVNVLKRELKLVGIRPLSEQYFNLYSTELQQQRLRHRPGLLPPYYADLPNDLDEIQASEKRYLDACEKQGTFITDFRYFFKIIYHILFHHARSR